MGHFWLKGSQWDYEVDTVKGIYPDAAWADVENWEGHTREWRLTMKPIPYDDWLQIILADLDTGKPVTVGDRGRVGHSSTCPTEGHATFTPTLHLPPREYHISLTYPVITRGDVSSAHPKVRLLIPDIVKMYPAHPHLFWHPNGQDAWACPISPQDNLWKWKRGATVAYLDQVAIWLLKTETWIATGGGIAGMGKWIGPAAGHRPLEHLTAISPTAPCWCGRGLRYEKCHMKAEIEQAVIQSIMRRTST